MGLLISVLFGIILLNENKALVFQNDARFVLSGPFSRRQVLAYILLNDLTQNLILVLMFSGYALFFFRSGSGTIHNFFILFITMFAYLLWMVMFSSYDYVLEKSTTKYRKYKKIVIFGLLIGFVVLVGYLMIKENLQVLELTQLFFYQPLYYYPFFGWLIATFYFGASSHMLAFFLMLLIPLGFALLGGILFFNNKVDFYEAALFDSERIQVILDQQKAGQVPTKKHLKVKVGNLYGGAWALWSSFYLQMRKANQFLRIQDFLLFGMYTAISYFIGDIDNYRLMLSLAIFLTINNDSLIFELKRPFVYLIPESAYKKMLILSLPLLYRMVLLTSLGGLLSIFLFKLSILEAIGMVLSLWGIALLLISGSMFSLRLLRGNRNPFIEQIIRMLVIVVAFIPVIIIMVLVTLFVIDIENPAWMNVLNLIMIIVNGGIYFLLVYASSKILKGNDMFA